MRGAAAHAAAAAHLNRAESRLVRRGFFSSFGSGRARLGRGTVCRHRQLRRRHDRGAPAALELRHVEVQELLRGLADVQQQLGASQRVLAQDALRSQHAVWRGEVGEAEALLSAGLGIRGAFPAAARRRVRQAGTREARAGFGGASRTCAARRKSPAPSASGRRPPAAKSYRRTRSCWAAAEPPGSPAEEGRRAATAPAAASRRTAAAACQARPGSLRGGRVKQGHAASEANARERSTQADTRSLHVCAPGGMCGGYNGWPGGGGYGGGADMAAAACSTRPPRLQRARGLHGFAASRQLRARRDAPWEGACWECDGALCRTPIRGTEAPA